MKKTSLSLLVFTLLATVAAAQAQTYSYRIVNFPGAAESGLINEGNSGAILGFFRWIRSAVRGQASYSPMECSK